MSVWDEVVDSLTYEENPPQNTLLWFLCLQRFCPFTIHHIPDWRAVICCIQSIGLTILSLANTDSVSLCGDAGLLLTAALGSKLVHWAGDLSAWVTSDRRNVLSGCPQQGYWSDVDRAEGLWATEPRASTTIKHSEVKSIKKQGKDGSFAKNNNTS